MSTEPQTQLDQAKLGALAGKVLGDTAGALGVLLSYIGDQIGVYRALEEAGPCTAGQLADKCGLNERYLLEWLSATTSLGYVTYEPEGESFSLSPEQAAVFAREGDPTCMQGGFQSVVGEFAQYEKAVDVFRSGEGRPWGDHHSCLFCGTDRFFKPGYNANLLEQWIPALEGVDAKLQAGGKVADVGCGYGSSTILMAKHYPNSVIHGFDFHELSIVAARESAEKEGVSNVEFFVSDAASMPDDGYDLACIFDALHDMGDPVGAASSICRAIKPDGTFMVVEPMAGDSLKENQHVLASLFYGFSTLVCVPTSKSQNVGLALGAQAGQKRLTEVLNQAGFNDVRRATETPTNMVLEARI